MRVQLAIPDEHVTPEVLEPLLEAGTRLDHRLMAAGQAPTFTQALQQGVRWQPEPPGMERFDHAGAVAGRGHGDCDDLAPMRAAELRLTGEDPAAVSKVIKTGPHMFHAYVQRGDGTWEDPSEEAGMYVPAGGVRPAATRAITRRPVPAVAMRPSRRVGAWQARAEIPWVGSAYKLSCDAIEADPRDAMSTAVMGCCLVGETAGLSSREHVAHLLALESAMRQAHPDELREALEQYGIPWTALAGAVKEGRRIARALGCM